MNDGISVIIPTLNEEYYLPRTLEALAKQNFAGKLQVIVVDGKSTDRTVAVAHSFEKELDDLTVVQTQKGIGHQRNVGAEKAKYNNIFFIDADIVLPKVFFNQFLQKLPKDKIAIASSFMWPADGNFLDFVVLGIAYPFIMCIYMVKPFIVGGLTYTKKETHEKIGGYIEGLLMGEDIDYAQRSIASGASPKLFFSPWAYHSVRRARQMGRVGLLWFWFKGWWYMQRHGLIREGGSFVYEYGQYNPSKNKK